MQTSLLANPSTAYCLPTINAKGRVEPLRNSEYIEVLAYLERRPIHTAYLAGLIRDNGIENALNRGTFYGYRNQLDEFEAVALIGHATLMETSSDQAIQAFAQTAQCCQRVHLIMFEENRINKFWGGYAVPGQDMHHASG